MSSKSPITQRRRGAALEEALLDAAWEELLAVGYRSLTFDNVAARADTSKAVLYRRWGNRLELVRAALRTHRPLMSGRNVHTGSLREDVIDILEYISSTLRELPSDLPWGLLSDAINDTEQHATLQQQIKQTNIDTMMPVLRDAEERGEIPTSALPERLITLPLDLSRHEMLITGGPVTRAAIVQIVDDIYLPLLGTFAK